MRWLIRAYTLILLAYTGWRTWDFMKEQLPESSTGFWLAILFLFTTEAGLALWHEVSIGHTTTFMQHNVSTWLTWMDFVGSLGAGVADMIIRQTMTEYAIPEWLAIALIFGLPAMVAINVAGALVFLSNDAEAQLDREQRFLVFEATRQAFRDLKANRGSIARERKREIAERLRTDALGQIDRDLVNPKVASSGTTITSAPVSNPTPARSRRK